MTEETPFEAEHPPTKRLKTNVEQFRDLLSRPLDGPGDLGKTMAALKEIVSPYVDTEKDDPKTDRFPSGTIGTPGTEMR